MNKGPGDMFTKLCVVNMAPGVIFITLHFLRNLGIGPISKLVTLHMAGKACQGEAV